MVEGLTWADEAAADLSSSLNRFVNVNSAGQIILASAAGITVGTLFEAAALGGAASIQTGGVAKVIVDSAVTAGTRIQVGASGGAAPGTTNSPGIALSGGAAGTVISVLLCH